jgi:hypothetical protein
MSEPTERVPELVRRLYALVAEFEALFNRPFTPDGHLVGSIGEVVAAHRYNLSLGTPSQGIHDALAPDGRHVQIKATQGRSVALRTEPEHVIVLRLERNGEATEVFNGPGAIVWQNCGSMQANGQRPISIATLRRLMSDIPPTKRIPERS